MDVTAADANGGETLSDVQLRLAAILDSAMDAILVAGADGRIVVFNPKAERTFGCRAAHAIGQPLERFVPRVNTHPTTASPCPSDAPGDTLSVTPAIVVARRANGDEFFADAVISRTGQDGRVEWSVILRDISDRRRAEDMLRQLSSALTLTADTLCVTDTSGTIEYVNPAFAATMGVTSDELKGRNMHVFKSGEHDRDFYERLWNTLRSGEVYRGVLIDRTCDGRMIHLDQTITPLKDDDGTITHFVAVGRDITARIETEAALRRLNEALERQAKDIAEALHDEAGQMLTSVYVALAQAKRELPPPADDHLSRIKRDLECIEEQLRRLAHELRPRILEDLGLVPALQFLADGFSQRSGIAVRVESTLPTRQSPLLEATIYRFAQEALSNARRHAHARQVQICLERLDRRLRCTIADDGVGFDAGAVVVSGDGEEGMGLSSIRCRIAALGGTFRIESAPGRGTQAVMTLPVGLPSVLLFCLTWVQATAAFWPVW